MKTKEGLQVELKSLINESIRNLNEMLKEASKLDLLVNLKVEDSTEHDNQLISVDYDEVHLSQVIN